MTSDNGGSFLRRYDEGIDCFIKICASTQKQKKLGGVRATISSPQTNLSLIIVSILKVIKNENKNKTFTACILETKRFWTYIY